MKRMKIVNFGTAVQGVVIRGNPKNPEPESFRIVIPGGDVEVVRTTDNEYWVHVRVDGLDSVDRTPGFISDARLDIRGKHSSDVDIGEFNNPDLYHLAVRVSTDSGDG